MEHRYLSDDAASEFLACCRLSLWMGLLGPPEFLGRLISLKTLSKPDSPTWHYCTKVLTFEECDQPEDWSDRDEGELEHDNVNGPARKVYSDDGEDPLILQFIPSMKSGLSGWEFHKGDVDPIPSVPHGHDRGYHKRKLDPYRGFISVLGESKGRVKRDSTVALWNDPAFRQFAREAIEHFWLAYPHTRWRVKNPMRLPRIRK